ncbi:RHS repeat protein [Pseudomonas aeruginosa]|uniref:RHS repeat protein n=1 Tax=Pseudomonas aeruginosa TaxID=287 RepID=UPI00104AD8CB|nr:RHS repeat protein [Pseudomonas aeruginosa]HCE6902071.1 RHS repeat protein [Pseudomonas aeruginosa]HCE6904529.1 RHS repeat protein [Pseudomonas aeruginosa]HCE6908176.1 RHS repeat protein [Pseudomonas aeruginosa]HCE7021368.1 RHS repeat protein [Pseudomonas aeruginosa]
MYCDGPVGRLLEAQSRLGLERFAFDPVSNLIDPEVQRDADRQYMPRPNALGNLLRQYAGTRYQYDARGNLSQRWHSGKESRYTWDLFDRLTRYEDERLAQLRRPRPAAVQAQRGKKGGGAALKPNAADSFDAACQMLCA